jgi:hypothetical protein
MSNETSANPNEADEIHNEDFQFVLKELLSAYRPILEEDLKRAEAPEELKKEAQSKPATCEDEIALANRIFDRFVTEEVAVRLLPEEGRKQLGPIENWRWCFLHIRCCIIFGWLLCRRQRTFRAFAYYLYRYWLCVRQVLDTPVSHPPTADEREDFQVLVKALASAYKPYLTDQLASIEFPTGIPDEVLEGKIDCLEGEEEAAAIFERLLTAETAPALLGRKAFEAHSRDPNFWFCRCWCLCAIRFGCCLARARNFVDFLRCLLFYRRCLRHCFQPIHCDVTAPVGCAEEQPGLPGLPPPPAVGLEIDGRASGAFFDHYTLEWRIAQGQPCQDNTTCPLDGSAEPTTGWTCAYISYPGGGATGTTPVVSGTLGVLDTTFLPTGSYEIRLCIYSTGGARTCCCGPQFALFKKLVFITRIAETPGAFVATPPGPFVGTSQIVSSNPAPPGVVVPVGGPISVWGEAFVGDCQNRKIKCIDLRAAIGFQVGPEDGGFAATLPLYTIPLLSTPICYDDVPPLDQIKKRSVRLDQPLSELTAFWKHLTFDGQPWVLKPNPFQSDSGLPVSISAAGCPDPHHRCRSGQYTILLDVTDTTTPFHYYDTQQVWFDNKTMDYLHHVVFHGLEGLPSCQDLHVNADSAFIPPGAPCNVAWPVNLLGIAYDEYIDETDLTYPSDNFDFYLLYIVKQTGEVLNVPITVAPDPANALHGIQRRGQPGVRCEPLPGGGAGCLPAEIVPGQSFDVLTALDMRVFDAVCAPSVPAPYSIPAAFPLPRGTCCGYTFQLYAQDKTWSDGYAGGFHRAYALPWAVCICNDLPKIIT